MSDPKSDEMTPELGAEEAAESAASAGEVAEPADNVAEPGPGADAEEAAEPEPVVVPIRRQSIVLRSGACDMRIGPGAADQLGQATKSVAGKPGHTLLVAGDDVPDELVERLRRSLVDVGFSVTIRSVPSGRESRKLAHAMRLYDEFAAAGVTPDDPVVAVGDADVLSLVLFAAATWQTGSPVVSVPTTLDGMVDVPVTPRAIDSASMPESLRTRANLRFSLCDTDLLPAAADDPTTLMAYAVLVAGAVAAGESAFSDLAVRADGIVSADAATLVDEILDITKARTRVASSTALAMRQGVLYGLSVGRALGACLAEQDDKGGQLAVEREVCEGRLLAEGLRISARLAAARQALDQAVVDLVFAQDGLLEKLGLPEVACNVDPARLLEALRADEYAHSNRFMPALPLGFGRVRLCSVEDETLLAHLSGWCRARRKLARRLTRQAEEAAASPQASAAGDAAPEASAAGDAVIPADSSAAE